MLKIRLMAIAWLINLSPQAAVAEDLDMAQVFSVEHANKAVLQVEAALALSQAEFGVIPQWAADEIKAKAIFDTISALGLSVEQRETVLKRQVRPFAARAPQPPVCAVHVVLWAPLPSGSTPQGQMRGSVGGGHCLCPRM